MNKIVIMLSILVGVGLMFGVSMVFAEHGRNDCSWTDSIWQGLCLKQINEKQDEIIDKLDWNNCAIKYKPANDYISGEYEKQGILLKPVEANNYKELVKYCGEMP